MLVGAWSEVLMFADSKEHGLLQFSLNNIDVRNVFLNVDTVVLSSDVTNQKIRSRIETNADEEVIRVRNETVPAFVLYSKPLK